MAVGPIELHEIPYERLFPWVRLFRAFGVATDAKKLLLAVLGIVCMFLGWAALDRLFSYSDPVRPPWPSSPSATFEPAYEAPWRLTEPVRALVGPFLRVFSPESTWATFFHAFLSAVWGVMVWGLFGGAIARIAVVQVARGERIGTVAALRFALRKWLTLIGAPLSPLLGVAFFALLCALFGLLYRVPVVGPVVAGVLLVLPLLAGLVMALILIGLALGWPLMPASVAAEAEDGFDAVSRTYAYVNQRRWHYLGYVVLAWLIGCAGLVFVDLMALLVVRLTHWSLSFGAPRVVLGGLFGTGGAPSAGLHSAWFSLVGLVAHGWIYSYFWSSAAIMYLLLRYSVDGTPVYEVRQDEALPVPVPPEPVEEPASAPVTPSPSDR